MHIILLFLQDVFRLCLGVLLLSTGGSKLFRFKQFRQGIREYRIIPSLFEKNFSLSLMLSVCVPALELIVGCALLIGLLVIPVSLLAVGLFLLFSGAIAMNLMHGHYDLSCHCGGVLGDHRISWWIVGRNMIFVGGFLFLVLVPSHGYNAPVGLLSFHWLSQMSLLMWIGTILPLLLATIGSFGILLLLIFACTSFRLR